MNVLGMCAIFSNIMICNIADDCFLRIFDIFYIFILNKSNTNRLANGEKPTIMQIVSNDACNVVLLFNIVAIFINKILIIRYAITLINNIKNTVFGK